MEQSNEKPKADIRLPRQELIDQRDFYTRSLANMKNLRDQIKKELDKPINAFYSDKRFTFLFGLFTMNLGRSKNWELDRAFLLCQLDELEAKIEIQQYHHEMYEERILNYSVNYNQDTEKANKGFDPLFVKGKVFAKINPTHPLAVVINDLPKMNFTQELKNEIYKSMVAQESVMDGWLNKYYQKLDDATRTDLEKVGFVHKSPLSSAK